MDRSFNERAEDLIGQALRPSIGTWLRHGAFLLATFVTATLAGVLFPFGRIDILPEADPQTAAEFFQFLLSLPSRYFVLIGTAFSGLLTDAELLRSGLSFSVSLLFILISHEMGHYVACRLYRVDSTLPFFIPVPPLISPAGTFGAFIKIRSPLPSVRAIFDIGVAGPIAGFIAMLPIAVIGVVSMKPVSAAHAALGTGVIFSDPLLMKMIALAVGVDLDASVGNPFYFAAWVGALVTALNLIPSGQLDGGHASFAVFGEQIHRWTGRVAFIVMASLSIVGWFVYSSPSGFLIAVLLGVMMRIKHPVPWDNTQLDAKRKAIAFLTLVIFVVCFLPFPVKIL